MTQKIYRKLVRDRIPEIIAADGEIPKTETLDDARFRTELFAKLREECDELVAAPDEKIPDEIADIREVLDAIAKNFGISDDSISLRQCEKREARGGFDRKIFLISTEKK